MTPFKKSSSALALTLLLALPLALSRLVVYGPQELKDKFDYSGKQQLTN
jgi:hypothetical protein